jgi:hypothetical protein
MNNFIVRAPTLDGAQSVAALIAERDRADFAEVDGISFTGYELREWWQLDSACGARPPEVDSENESGATRLYERTGCISPAVARPTRSPSPEAGYAVGRGP